MKRLHALILVAAVIAGVAGARVLLRDDGTANDPRVPAEAQASPSGRTVPLTLAPLPPTLKQEGELVCAELKNPNGTYTARAQGGSIRNVSDGPLTYQFTFDVSARAQTETVSSRFRLEKGHGVPSFTMASKSLAEPVTKCALRIVGAEVTRDDIGAVDAAARAIGCTAVMRHDSEGHDHIQPPATATYGTKPPTSGNHYPAPAGTGVHDQPIRDETQVHNLEHGHIGLQYRGVSRAARGALEEIAGDDPRWTFVAPYPSMRPAIAMTAWTVSLECASEPKDTDALRGLARLFATTFKDHGRESIPGTPA